METRFNPILVVLSVLVSILAAYVALNLAYSVTQSKGRARAAWLSGGALAMGVGIWSMHFVGMLAFEMPGMAMAYDIPLMILSIVVAIVASALALYIVSQPIVTKGSILSGGVAMAAAIAGMHYIGMYSMRMEAVVQWNVFLVVLSVVIALVASLAALKILVYLRNQSERIYLMILASTVMGFAIAGMHYTGMLAATFIHLEGGSNITQSNLLVTSGLATAVISTTLLILGLALAGSVGQRVLTHMKKQSAQVLNFSEQRFRLLVEAVKDYAIFMLDPKGYVTTWNSGAEKITGYKAGEIIGKHFSIFSTQDDLDTDFPSEELRIANQEGHFETEGLRVRKNGSTYWANIVITPLYDEEEKLTGFSIVTRDITRIKEGEARMRKLNEELEQRVVSRTHDLQRSESQLRSITNAIPVLVGQVDNKERFLFANEALCNWFSRDPESIIGTTFRELLGEERHQDNKPYIDKVLSSEITHYERVSKGPEYTAVLDITFVPEFDEADNVTSFILVANDITKHKEIEQELKKAKEAAEVANMTKSAFLANMSHEIRTPLGAVLGFSELMMNEEMPVSERANTIEIIKRNGRMLSNIINDILDLSKVEAGRLEVEKIEVPFPEIMTEISSMVNLEAAEKGIELKLTSEGPLPNTIKTDPLRLRQILLNIIGNAVKFTERGKVEVTVKMLPESGAGVKLAFIVKDTGEGISAEQASRLFTPFTQADVSTTRRFGGTGLGLVLSKKLANALGGDLILQESTLHAGSTFVVTIDPGISQKTLFQGTSTFPSRIAGTASSEQPVNLSAMKILVVDDSPENQVLIEKFLSIAGARTEVANNGREAVEMALNGDFHMVLMDLQMPEMDGYQATQMLREQGYKKPIIALTAHAMKEDRRRCLESGFDDHLTKPVDRRSLLQTLSEYTV